MHCLDTPSLLVDESKKGFDLSPRFAFLLQSVVNDEVTTSGTGKYQYPLVFS